MKASDNIILKSDSYKATHWPQYPPNTNKIFSYLESRGGKFDSTLFTHLQYILKRHFTGVVVTKEAIDQAEEFYKAHFGANLFNRAGWERIVTKHGGKLPLKIRAVPEGTVVPVNNVLMTIENTDPELFWLTNYAETLLLQIWYPITVATNSFECKKLIRKYLLETTGHDDNLLFKLHDFGFRGVGSWETAAVGGMAHLINFMGTDTTAAIVLAMEYYNAKICGHSIPASEHSTITSWGRENELKAFENMLTQYPTGLVACVSDSYHVYDACEKLWGETLRDKVMNRDGTLVIRPDSGNPPEVLSRILDILWNKFGGDYTQKGFKLLTPKVRIIQGDGIDYEMIGEILLMMKNKGFSTDNIAFGSGGGLLQKFDRDTQKFAIKCSYAEINGMPIDVYKDPVTGSGKKSKKGRLKLHKTGPGEFMTLSSAEIPQPMFDSYIDELVTVFENGELVKEYSFDEIRNLSNVYLKL